MLEDFTQSLGIVLRLARLSGEQDGGLHPLGHGLTHQLGRELDGSEWAEGWTTSGGQQNQLHCKYHVK